MNIAEIAKLPQLDEVDIRQAVASSEKLANMLKTAESLGLEVGQWLERQGQSKSGSISSPQAEAARRVCVAGFAGY